MPVQAPIEPKHTTAPPKAPRVQVYWHAVTYKTVMLYVLIVAGLIFGVVYLISPDLYSSVYHKVSNAIIAPDGENLSLSQMQAKFVNLDGKVQILSLIHI